VIKPGQSGVTVLVANYHAPDGNSEAAINCLKKFGVSNIVLQKDVFNPELYFRLLDLAKMSELGRMTQFKHNPLVDTAHLLTYPVLMTHDVAGYCEVLVGEDQQQHLEFARKLLARYNGFYKADYPIPETNIVVGRIKDLRVPSVKMSKSSPQGCLFLDDSPDEIRKKLRRAVMDENGIENLKFLYGQFVQTEVPSSNQELKDNLAEALTQFLGV
jgi:tryptophanyl-tRNA synthetase